MYVVTEWSAQGECYVGEFASEYEAIASALATHGDGCTALITSPGWIGWVGYIATFEASGASWASCKHFAGCDAHGFDGQIPADAARIEEALNAHFLGIA